MRNAPNFDLVDDALEAALAALPLGVADGVDPELRREYSALLLYVLHTKERLALLHGAWAAQGLPVAAPAPISVGAPPPRERKRRPRTA